MQHKKLHLSKEHRVLAGVCGGLAEYFETDPVLIRLIFLFFSIIGGGGILLYIVLWIFMSSKQDLHKVEEELHAGIHRHNSHTQGTVGFFLIIIGLMLLLDRLFPGFGIRTFWPLLLILFGLSIMVRKQ